MESLKLKTKRDMKMTVLMMILGTIQNICMKIRVNSLPKELPPRARAAIAALYPRKGHLTFPEPKV